MIGLLIALVALVSVLLLVVISMFNVLNNMLAELKALRGAWTLDGARK